MQSFIDSTPQQLQRVVTTNMTGTLLCTRAAMQVMQKQEGGGHIFNMDGAGADGMPTPQYAAYGATKAGMPHHLLQCMFVNMLHLMLCMPLHHQHLEVSHCCQSIILLLYSLLYQLFHASQHVTDWVM